MTVRVDRPQPMVRPARSNQTSQVASQVRYCRSASVSAMFWALVDLAARGGPDRGRALAQDRETVREFETEIARACKGL